MVDIFNETALSKIPIIESTPKSHPMNDFIKC